MCDIMDGAQSRIQVVVEMGERRRGTLSKITEGTQALLGITRRGARVKVGKASFSSRS